ncbi:substrate-binding domain-containing protein [Pseudoduganella armeniaca]|nr:substrate-binding domain-containing protein [Pseudoduganella armeniaca]
MPARPHPSPLAPTAPPSRAVHLAGATTMLPLMQRLAEAYMGRDARERVVITEGGGTARGYKAVLDRTADIAMASGPVPDDFNSELQARVLALHRVTLGRDPIAILVHASNPVSNISLRQLADLFTGRIGNWRDAGGPDGPVQVLVGPPGGGVSAQFKQVLGSGASYTPSRLVLDSGARLLRAASDPAAITFAATMAPQQLALKVLTVDHLSPAAPAYPLQTPLTLALAGQPSGPAGALIRFLAVSWSGARAGAPGLSAMAAAHHG